MSFSYVLRRLLQAVPTILGILVLTFVLIQMAPGDAADTLSEGDVEYTRQLRAQLRLDRPLIEQFGAYATRVLRGDLGVSSTQNGRSVSSLIGEYLPRTVLLMGTAVVLSSLVGIALAARAGRRPNGPLDSTVSLGALVAYAVPGLWLGQLAILFLGLRTGWFPIGGMTNARADYGGIEHVLDVVAHLALPVLVLATSEVAVVYRVTRAGILQETRKEYVRTALAKGVRADRVLSHHAMRNALLPTVTVIGTRVGFLFSGAVVIERLFAWPGMGTLLITSAERRDRPVVLGVVLVVAFALVAATLITDLIYALIDPRIRYD